MSWRKKQMENEEIIPQQKAEVTPPPHITPPQPPPKRVFLLKLVGDEESEDNIVIQGLNILDALEKFVQKYKGECTEWVGLALSVEEVETII